MDHAEVALGVWRELGISRGHLLAHDYGTSVATELLARRERRLSPVGLDSVALCNGSVHLRLAKLRLSQRLLRSRLTGLEQAGHYPMLETPAVFAEAVTAFLT